MNVTHNYIIIIRTGPLTEYPMTTELKYDKDEVDNTVCDECQHYLKEQNHAENNY